MYMFIFCYYTLAQSKTELINFIMTILFSIWHLQYLSPRKKMDWVLKESFCKAREDYKLYTKIQIDNDYRADTDARNFVEYALGSVKKPEYFFSKLRLQGSDVCLWLICFQVSKKSFSLPKGGACLHGTHCPAFTTTSKPHQSCVFSALFSGWGLPASLNSWLRQLSRRRGGWFRNLFLHAWFKPSPSHQMGAFSY